MPASVWFFACLYLAQGLPSGFLAHVLPAVLREAGASLSLIAALKLLALPWFLKVFWAPLVDTYGQRQHWIYTCQGTLVGLLVLLSLQDLPQWLNYAALFYLILLLINLSSATQDIATDGWAMRLIDGPHRGWLNSVQVAGYKAGMIVSGSGLLWLIHHWGFGKAMQLLALFVAALLLVVPLIKRLAAKQGNANTTANKRTQRQQKFDWAEYKNAFLGLYRSPEFRLWLPLLLCYKVADSLGSTLVKPMLVDAGWQLDDIAQLVLVKSLAGLAAALLAGWVYQRLGARKSLLIFSALQGAAVSAYGLLALGFTTPLWVYSIAVSEQIADALSTVVLFAAMMSFCRVGHEGGDFSLQTALQVVIAGTFSVFAGLLAQILGYSGLYVLVIFVSVLTVWICLKYNQRSRFLDEVSGSRVHQ